MKKPLVQIEDLKTWFPVRRGIFSRTAGYVKAVDGVSLDIPRGETLGLVGESGCGKTTLGRTVLGLEKAYAGRISFDGTELSDNHMKHGSPVRMKMQMIFQDPLSSLNPRMSVLDIITEGLSEYKLLTKKREEHAAELLTEVGLQPEAMFKYPHEFSGGQRQRISIARAISVKPDFIVCDEAVSALDVSVQAQVVNLLMDLQQKYGMSYLFISHDLSVVSQISTKIAVMYLGQIVEFGDTESIINKPSHPYSKALIESVPVPGKTKKKGQGLKGETPSPKNPPSGCRFHPRCPSAMDICAEKSPEEVGLNGCIVKCHLY